MPKIGTKYSFIKYNTHDDISCSKLIYDLKNKCIYNFYKSSEIKNSLILDDNQAKIYKLYCDNNNKKFVCIYSSPKMILNLSNFEINESHILYSNCILLTNDQIEKVKQFNNKIVCYNFNEYLHKHGNIKINYRHDLYNFITNDMKEMIYNKSINTIYRIYQRKYEIRKYRIGKYVKTNCYTKELFIDYACKYFNLKIEYNRFIIKH